MGPAMEAGEMEKGEESRNPKIQLTRNQGHHPLILFLQGRARVQTSGEI